MKGKRDCFVTVSKTYKKTNGLLFLVHLKTPDDKKGSPGKQLMEIRIGKEEEIGTDEHTKRTEKAEQWVTVVTKRYATGEVDNNDFKQAIWDGCPWTKPTMKRPAARDEKPKGEKKMKSKHPQKKPTKPTQAANDEEQEESEEERDDEGNDEDEEEEDEIPATPPTKKPKTKARQSMAEEWDDEEDLGALHDAD